MSSLFYLPVAELLASFTAWVLIEPYFADFSLIGGEVLLVNSEPFEFGDGSVDPELGDAINLTIGDNKVIVFPNLISMEPGADSQPPFNDISEVQPGTYLEAVGEVWAENEMVAGALRPATATHAGEISAAHLWSQPLQWHQAPPPRSQPRRRPPAPRPWQRASHELKTRWTESTTDRFHQTPRARAACKNVHGGNSWRSSRAPSVSGTRSGQLQSLLFS